jgi:toxin ParE1/3/4
MKVEWSVPAVSDLKAISEYIERDRSLEAANRITRTIYEAAQSLRTMPYRGRSGRVDNTRELVIPRLPYILVYRFDSRFPRKQAIAAKLLRRGIAENSLRVPHQAIVEFVAAVTHPRRDGTPLGPGAPPIN